LPGAGRREVVEESWTRLRSLAELAWALVLRELAARHKGSFLGTAWLVLNPLLMLLVFTFVFGVVFQARWQDAGGEVSMAEFAVILFVGLTAFQLFADVVNRAPLLVVENANYVKKIVFPLQILPVVTVGASLFQGAVGFALAIVAVFLVTGRVPATALLLPVVVAPYVAMILGIAWIVSALGAYVRDVAPVMTSVVTMLLFVSGIFFPLSALPAWVQDWVMLSPVALPVDMARQVLVFGVAPDWMALAAYAAAAALVAAGGYAFFQATRKGFADVV
jgi:lipopolysaccharide transport system permease protein